MVLNSIVSKAHPTQSIRSSFDSNIPEQIHTDPRRLQQILFNLLGNAIKFSPDDGVIKLSIEMMPMQSSHEGEISNNSSNEKIVEASRHESRMLRFTVEDNGKGIEESDLKRIFQPFQQASATAENVYGGTGLGLSITQKIVTALGGTINVTSKKGEWSKFTVDIPCHDATVDIQDISEKVKHCVVHIVGFHETEQAVAECILETYSLGGLFFNTLDDMLEVYERTALEPEQIHVCLLHESCFDKGKASCLHQSITITFGQHFDVCEDNVSFHFRSLEYLLPSYFVNSLIRSISKAKQRKDSLSTVGFTATSEENRMTSYTEMKVLIAEDNVVNQKVLTRILNRLNVENIDMVENGLEACKKVKETHYELIFMDQQMPIMGGVAACRQILEYYNENDEQNHLRPTIVFATAHVSADFEMECLDAGGSGFVPKPFNLDVIEKCLLTVHEQRLKQKRKI